MSTEAQAESQGDSQLSEVLQSLELIRTQLVESKALRVVNSITPLRNLYDINISVYRGALDAWREDFLGLCQRLDTSGVSRLILAYGRSQLQDGFSFSKFLTNNKNELFVVKRFFQLIDEWGVLFDKREIFLADMDATVMKYLAMSSPERFFSFIEIEPAFRNVFSMLDQEDAFKDWEHLTFKWKAFASSALIPLGLLAGTAVLVPITPVVVGGVSVGAVAILIGAALGALQ